MTNIRHLLIGLGIVGKANSSLASDTLGEIEVDSTNNFVVFHNGTSRSPMVTQSHSFTGANRLQNKDLEAGSTNIVDGTDTSKKIAFSASGNSASAVTTIAGSSTSSATLTLPPASDTLVARTSTDTGANRLQNKELSNDNVKHVDPSDTTKKIAFSAASNGTGITTTISAANATASTVSLPTDTNAQIISRLSTDQGANRVKNKDLEAGTTAIVDSSDTSKKIVFTASGNSTGVVTTIAGTSTSTATLSLPPATDTLVARTSTDTGANRLQNKELSNDNVKHVDASDTSKKIAFSSSGATTSTTTTIAAASTSNRTLTLPDATDTVVALAATQTLSNKTFSDAPTIAQISTPSSPASGFNKIYPKSNGQFYNLSSSGVETPIGGSTGATGKNYLTTYNGNTGNGNFELGSTTGWSTFNAQMSGTTPSTIITASHTTTATASNNSNSLTVADATSIQINQKVTGTGIPANTRVTNVSGTTITISNNTSQSLSSSSVTFAPYMDTFSTISSGQLAGTYSLQISNTSTIYVGNGFCTSAFTIDTEDQSKVMAFNFYYSVNSGAANCNFSGTSSNTFAVYIWDVTNSAFIQPQGVYNLIQSSGVGFCSGTFQTTSNSTQYQLAVLCINSTSGGTATVYFDDFYVGPQRIVYGPAMTDFTSYTPALAAFTGATAVSNVNFFQRRVGDSLEVFGYFTSGTPAASTSKIELPSGLTTASAFTNGSVIGEGNRSNTGNAANSFTVLGTASATYVSLGLQAVSGNNPLTSQNANSIIATSDNVAVYFKVPISGWSSNTSMSQDTDTRVVAMQATTTAVIATSAGSAAVFPVSTFDTHNAYNTSTGKYTVPVSGYYNVSVSGIIPNSGNTYCSVELFKNDSYYKTLFSLFNGNDVGSGSTLVSCNAGDTLKISTGGTNSGTGFAYSAGNGGYAPVLSINRLSGPATIAATESVSARYFSSTTGLSGSLANITYATKDWDTHNAYSSGTYTIPTSGKYQVNCGILMTATTTAANNLIQLQINKNGSAYSGPNDNYFTSSTSKPMMLELSDIVNCVAGDTITIQASNGGSTPSISASNSANYFSIVRVSN